MRLVLSCAFIVAWAGSPALAHARGDETAPPPATAALELAAPEPEVEEPVAADSRPEPHTVPDEAKLVPVSSSTDYRWYGWQTLTFDALSIGALVTALNHDESPSGGELMIVGLLGYLFGGPIVHGAHGHSGKALGSFGLRFGAPVLGAILGSLSDCKSDDQYGDENDCRFEGVGEGILLGAALAILVDATVLANEDVNAAPSAPPERELHVQPDVSVTRDRAVFSLRGRF